MGSGTLESPRDLSRRLGEIDTDTVAGGVNSTVERDLIGQAGVLESCGLMGAAVAQDRSRHRPSRRCFRTRRRFGV